MIPDIRRIKKKQSDFEKRIAILEAETSVLKKTFALLLAETGLTNQELAALKPRAREIYQLLSDRILDE